MSLRFRLLAIIALTTLPLLVGLVWIRQRVQLSEMRETAAAMLDESTREACEADPAQFFRGGPPPPPPDEGGPRPPPRGRRFARFFVYDDRFQGHVRDAPVLQDGLIVEAKERGSASHTFDRGSEVLVKTAWGTGRCAYVLARHMVPRDAPGAFGELLIPSALVLLIMLALWIPLGRTVERLKRVADAARKGGSAPVTGNDEITQVATAFNTALQTVEARERGLREFLANTTHDIMIPLTVLQGALSKLPEARAAREEADYIASIVSNLSAAAKLEAGDLQIHRAETSLDAVVERAVERYKALATERGIELNVATESVKALCDPTLTEQCISNLVSNAVRYNKAGGHVAVTVQARGKEFLIRVMDDGPGMSEDDRKRALQRGFRSQQSRRENPDGMGIGLSIAAEVALRHQWALALQPSEFGGLEARISGGIYVP